MKSQASSLQPLLIHAGCPRLCQSPHTYTKPGRPLGSLPPGPLQLTLKPLTSISHFHTSPMSPSLPLSSAVYKLMGEGPPCKAVLDATPSNPFSLNIVLKPILDQNLQQFPVTHGTKSSNPGPFPAEAPPSIFPMGGEPRPPAAF